MKFVWNLECDVCKELCHIVVTTTDLSMEQLEFFRDLYRAGMKKENVGLKLVQSQLSG